MFHLQITLHVFIWTSLFVSFYGIFSDSATVRIKLLADARSSTFYQHTTKSNLLNANGHVLTSARSEIHESIKNEYLTNTYSKKFHGTSKIKHEQSSQTITTKDVQHQMSPNLYSTQHAELSNSTIDKVPLAARNFRILRVNMHLGKNSQTHKINNKLLANAEVSNRNIVNHKNKENMHRKFQRTLTTNLKNPWIKIINNRNRQKTSTTIETNAQNIFKMASTLTYDVSILNYKKYKSSSKNKFNGIISNAARLNKTHHIVTEHNK
jgi:hypothetical protein